MQGQGRTASVAVISPRREEKPSVTENEVRRVKVAVAHKVLGAEYGSILGVMRLRGELTESEYEAGRWAQQVRSNYCRAIIAKGLKAQDLSSSGMGADTDPESAAAMRPGGMNERDQKAVAKHGDLASLMRQCGAQASSVFDRLVLISDTDALGLFPGAAERNHVKTVCRVIRMFRESAWRTKARVARG